MSLFARIREDIDSIMERDPAARSRLEVLSAIPAFGQSGFTASRIRLWRRNLRLPARILSQIARFYTGVDIHPGALLGGGSSSITPRASSSAKPPSWAAT